MGKVEEATVQFQEALQLNPDDPNLQNNFAKAQAIARKGTDPQ
jgi:Flp pilus assembly protein TadD